jgi:hypothetical protein
MPFINYFITDLIYYNSIFMSIIKTIEDFTFSAKRA